MDTIATTGLDALKTSPKNVLHKAAKATVEYVWNKVADKIIKPRPFSDENLRDFEKKNIPSEKREEILNKLRQVL